VENGKMSLHKQKYLSDIRRHRGESLQYMCYKPVTLTFARLFSTNKFSVYCSKSQCQSQS